MATSQIARDGVSLLVARLEQARAETDKLFTIIAQDALYSRPIPERHRLIFYLGHLEAFDRNLLKEPLAFPPHNEAFDKLFSFGIDPTDGDLPNDQPSDWPPEVQVREYNRVTRRQLDERISGNSRALHPLVADGTLLHVAIEHRLMHAETLAYLLHQLPHGQKRSPGRSLFHSAAPLEQRMMPIPAGIATLGQPRRRANDGFDSVARAVAFPFGWDNEFKEATVEVPAFLVGAFPVTNAGFLEFVRAGGYDDRSLWTEENWNWKNSAGVQHPFFWSRTSSGGRANGAAGEWLYRGMFQEFPLPMDWPVYVSHAEASAYARWRGQRLPTEAQWHRAAYGTPAGAERLYPWGDADPDTSRGNFDFAGWDPSPANAHPAGASAFGICDLAGNGWEWTSTPFAPLPGFEAFPFYAGYSANFFDGVHFVMKGGSPRTAACFLRRPFRNWFQPRYPYVYAKFRLVEE